MAVAGVFSSLVRMRQLTAFDALLISSVAIMKDSGRMAGDGLKKSLQPQRFEVALLTMDSVKQ